MRKLILVLIALCAIVGTFGIVNAESVNVVADIQPQMSLTVTPSATLSAWHLSRTGDNQVNDAILLHPVGDAPYKISISAPSLTNGVNTLTNPMNIASGGYESGQDLTTSPFTLWHFGISENGDRSIALRQTLVSGDKPGSGYASTITITMEVDV
jgi:hypothetical protein